MIVLAHGTGAQDFYILDHALPPELWQRVRNTVLQLLRKRNQFEAAQALESLPFELYNASNGFDDQFYPLRASLSLDRYVEFSAAKAEGYEKSTYNEIQGTLSELGYYVRFIAAELVTSDAPEVSIPILSISSQAVERSLRDAEHLTSATGASSAVDRVHTAFHGYLLAVCAHVGTPVPTDASATQLFKLLRTQHLPLMVAFSASPASARVVHSLANIVDALNSVRNKALWLIRTKPC